MPATATVAGGATARLRGGSPQGQGRLRGRAAGWERSVIRVFQVKESRIPLSCIQATLAVGARLCRAISGNAPRR